MKRDVCFVLLAATLFASPAALAGDPRTSDGESAGHEPAVKLDKPWSHVDDADKSTFQKDAAKIKSEGEKWKKRWQSGEGWQRRKGWQYENDSQSGQSSHSGDGRHFGDRWQSGHGWQSDPGTHGWKSGDKGRFHNHHFGGEWTTFKNVLTKAQLPKYESIIKASREEMMPLFERMQQLRTATEDGKPDMQKFEDISKKMRDRHRATREQLMALLTPAQKAKYEKAREKDRQEHGHDHHFGFGGADGARRLGDGGTYKRESDGTYRKHFNSEHH